MYITPIVHARGVTNVIVTQLVGEPFHDIAKTLHNMCFVRQTQLYAH